MQELRDHQAQLERRLERWPSDQAVNILCHVVPGGGKSWLPAITAGRFPRLKMAWFTPRVNLTTQAARSMLERGISINECDNAPDPSRGTRGFVVSHQGLTSNPDLYAAELERHPYFIVWDEMHHAKRSRAGKRNQLATAMSRLQSLVRVQLCMTGTLSTNDDSFIEGIRYRETAEGWEVDPAGSADIYIRYDRRMAIAERAVVPMEFYHHDGPVRFRDREGPQDVRLSKAERHLQSGALHTALKTDLATQLLHLGIGHWRSHGDQLIVIASDQTEARKYHQIMANMGIPTALCISDEGPEAHDAIESYRAGYLKAMATCAMCYEGLDAPRTTHLVGLTHIRSIPWIEQALARAWRSSPGKDRCWAFVPDDPLMRYVIEQIRIEEIATVTAPDREGGGNGGGPRSIIPESGHVEAINSAYLDEDVIDSENRDKVYAAMDQLGLNRNDPVFDELMTAVSRRSKLQVPAPPLTTERQEADRLRKGMTDLCRKADYSRGAPDKVAWGTTQMELNRKIGIRFKDATLSELKRAAEICAQHCDSFITG